MQKIAIRIFVLLFTFLTQGMTVYSQKDYLLYQAPNSTTIDGGYLQSDEEKYIVSSKHNVKFLIGYNRNLRQTSSKLTNDTVVNINYVSNVFIRINDCKYFTLSVKSMLYRRPTISIYLRHSDSLIFRTLFNQSLFIQIEDIIPGEKINTGVPCLLFEDAYIDTVDIFAFAFLRAKSLEFKASLFKTLKIADVSVKRLTMDRINLNKLVFRRLCVDSVDLLNLDLKDFNGQLDLREIYNDSTSVILRLRNIDFNKLIIPLDHVIIDVDTAQSFEKQSTIYQLATKSYLDAGLSEKARDLDKKFQRLRLLHEGKFITNWINSHWWDYGYDKGRVFKIAFIAFGIFFVVNIFSFKLLSKIYLPRNIYSYNKMLTAKYGNKHWLVKNLSKLPAVFVYTATIFWGIKLDIKELSFRNWYALILIIIEYTFGIICLAYIANFIITK